MATLFRNGHFFTDTTRDHDSSTSASTSECMIISSDTITYIGPEDPSHPIVAAALSSPATTTTIDLHQKWVLPGFIDSHMHLLLFGSSLTRVNLEPCKNLDDIRSTIKSYALAHPEAPRILCRGWMHPMTNGVALASMIDDLDPRPIFIDSKDLHSTWCNTAALHELGIANEPNPSGGEIARDPITNTPTGLISEAAAQVFVWPHVARVQPLEDKLASFQAAIESYNAAGYTGMIDMAMDENAWEALQLLQARYRSSGAPGLPVRLAAHWLINPKPSTAENLRQVDRAIELYSEFNSHTSPDLRIAGIKVICDGVVDACTAALCEPYAASPAAHGPVASPDTLWPEDKLREVVRHADAAGLQCALHAIGDGAVKMAIDALEAVCSTPTTSSTTVVEADATADATADAKPGSIRGHDKRHRIEHLELTRPADAARLGSLGITASIQAVHADPAILRAWPKLLGPQRCTRAFAYKDFADQGAVLALGTDSPTAPHAPLRNIYTATTRRSAREPENTQTVNPEYALSLAQGVNAATRGAAYSCFADERVGTLREGYKADFVLVDMQFDEEKLLEARVAETWMGGRRVFESVE